MPLILSDKYNKIPDFAGTNHFALHFIKAHKRYGIHFSRPTEAIPVCDGLVMHLPNSWPSNYQGS